MIVKNAKFELTAVRPEQYPTISIPEVALAGRSNVGKSSFINTLLNRKNLARVGATPGKTREINFYNVDGALFLVDMPGYGYAGVSKGKKSSWGEVVETYFNARHQLSMLILLVDIRHKPSEDDKLMYEWLSGSGIPHMVVASKADKISRSQAANRVREIRQELGMGDDVKLIAFSSETRQGKDEVWAVIDSLIGQ